VGFCVRLGGGQPSLARSSPRWLVDENHHASAVPFDGPKGALRPDGRAVAVNHGDEFTIWDLDADHLAAAACRLAGRNLTPTEWQTYLVRDEYRFTCPAYA
jgi:hypothetical protein